MYFFKNFSFALTTLLITGCATIDVSSDYDPTAQFSQLRTYSWALPATQQSRDPRINNTLVDDRIRRAVNLVLAERGYTPVPEGQQPDFWVGYHAAIHSRIDVDTFTRPGFHSGFYFGDWYGTGWYDPFWRTETYGRSYEEGMLVLDVINPQTKKLMWQGIARAALDEKATPQERDKKVEKAVRKMLKSFPPVGTSIAPNNTTKEARNGYQSSKG